MSIIDYESVVKSFIEIASLYRIFNTDLENESRDYEKLFIQSVEHFSAISEFNSGLPYLDSCKDAINGFSCILSSVTDKERRYNNTDCDNAKLIFIHKSCMNHLGDIFFGILKDYQQTKTLTDGMRYPNMEEILIHTATEFYKKVIDIDDNNNHSKIKLSNFYSSVSDLYINENVCKQLINMAIQYFPENPLNYYKLGIWFSNNNDTIYASNNLKLAIFISESMLRVREQDVSILKNIIIASCYKIAEIFNDSKMYANAILYLDKGFSIDPNNPDIAGMYALVSIEQHKYDIAIHYIHIGIESSNRTTCPEGITHFKTGLYSNLGLIYYLTGNNIKATDNYMIAFNIIPRLKTYQNILLSSINGFMELDDKTEIKQLHCNIDKQYDFIRKTLKNKYIFSNNMMTNCNKINIGIVSSDLKNHVVFAFISSYLDNFDNTNFTVTCYVPFDDLYNIPKNDNKVVYKNIKYKSTLEASNEIYDDKIHILLDLNGHTAENRIDIFTLNPAPIQISYLGYPFSTGISEMEYRITDSICDRRYISDSMYSEKLLYMKDCFICFNPAIFGKNDTGIYNPIVPAPYSKSRDFIRMGCFSRPDKLSDSTIAIFQDILRKNERVLLIFKFRGSEIHSNRMRIMDKFEASLQPRISFIDYTETYLQHLDKYNDIDFSIDTFPYSGTTTCCDSLFMGTPMFTLYDDKDYFHAHNVSTSIIRNTSQDLEFFILKDRNSIHDKIQEIQIQSDIFWHNLKVETREKFLSGKICDKVLYTKNIEALFTNVFNEKKNRYKIDE
jgi:predicted O-linked N-acetylglucosamine transferase (SPINDLY family)